MKTFLTLLLALGLCQITLSAQETSDWRTIKHAGTRFAAVDVLVDAGVPGLAAYQLTFRARRGDVKIVGIEGGAHPAFKNPPFYDPKAMQHEKVVLAAFNTATPEKLPHGWVRVATVHVQISGSKEPEYTAKLEAAADSEGRPIPAKVNIEERKKP